jgi:hypothetical protein
MNHPVSEVCIDGWWRGAPDHEPSPLAEPEYLMGVDLAAEDTEEMPCPMCGGGGWECYGIGHSDPHFRECRTCYNPEGLPCP